MNLTLMAVISVFDRSCSHGSVPHHNIAVNIAAPNAIQARRITARKYLLSFSTEGSRVGDPAWGCFGNSSTNRLPTARSSDRNGRVTGNRAIIGTSSSAASAFGKAASRAASSHGSTPSRVNAEITLRGTPFCSSPTEAKRKSFRSECRSENRAANVIICNHSRI